MRIAATVASLLLATTLPASAVTETIVVDESTPGTVYDGLVDGFPGLAPRDGTADFGGNPLSAARQADVTETRAVVEFPLAPVAGQPIVAARLVFNIDDVIATFGPNTAFNGKAASTLLVHPYDGDGATLLNDYKRTDETAYAVPTGPGVITDASLKQTGAVFFAVDVRDRVAAAVAAGTPFIGFLWRTTDSPTATSLDDGGGGVMAGEGGETSAGSRMPVLEIEYGAVGPACIDGTTCDDANPCTLNDVCSGGACVGDPVCGNGTIDASCGEVCDDGNAAGADGCATTCQPDTLAGKGKTPCLLELAFEAPARDAGGAVTSPQGCTDGAACDADPTPDTCGFMVAACVGRCDALTGVAPAVVSPNRSAKQRANRERLDAALAGLAAPSCSSPVRIDVRVKRKGSTVKAGKAKLVLRAKAPGVGRDKDAVLLVCHPAP